MISQPSGPHEMQKKKTYPMSESTAMAEERPPLSRKATARMTRVTAMPGEPARSQVLRSTLSWWIMASTVAMMFTPSISTSPKIALAGEKPTIVKIVGAK